MKIKMKMYSDIPNLDDLLYVFFSVRFCTHNEDTVKKVNWETVWAAELCSSYPRHAAVGSHDD